MNIASTNLQLNRDEHGLPRAEIFGISEKLERRQISRHKKGNRIFSDYVPQDAMMINHLDNNSNVENYIHILKFYFYLALSNSSQRIHICNKVTIKV